MSGEQARPSTSDLAVLRFQEQLLTFEAPFTSATALELGSAIAELSPWEGKGFSAAIVRDADDLVMFQWAADDQGVSQRPLHGRQASGLSTCREIQLASMGRARSYRRLAAAL